MVSPILVHSLFHCFAYLTFSFELLLHATEHCRKYPSIAENAGTNERFVHHVITRVLNKINSLIEVSDTQACYALLGMSAGLCSDIFTSMDMLSYVEFVLEEKKKQIQSNRHGDAVVGDECSATTEETLVDKSVGSEESPDDKSMASFIVQDSDTKEDTNEPSRTSVFDHSNCDSQGEDSMACESSISENLMDESHSLIDGEVPSQIYINNEERDDADCPFESFSLNPSRYSSACPIYKIDDGENIVAVPYPKLYCYRGAGLRQISRYEYCTQVKIEKQKKEMSDGNTEKQKRGRKEGRIFEFGKGFELH